MFDLIDLDEKDDVVSDMETQVEKLINGAVEWLMQLPDYNIREYALNDNPHIKVTNMQHYS